MATVQKSELDAFGANSRAIVKAADDADPVALALELAASPDDPILRHSFREGFRGTLLYRTLDKAVLYANSKLASLVDGKLDCARLLRAAGAPAISPNPHPADVATIFLDTDWSSSGATKALAHAFEELIDAGLVDPEVNLPPNTRVGRMSPLLAACKVGNPAALEVLLRKGVRMSPPRAGQDILQLAGTIAEANRGAIVALMAERLMRDRLAGTPAPDTSTGQRRVLGI